MIFHFLSLAAIVSAQEQGTDCNAVRRFLFPNAPECAKQQFCSDDFACVVTADCASYTCVADSDCPVGTKYKVFSSSPTATQSKKMITNSFDGYYCAESGLECGFNDEGRFFIDTVVKDREPWNGYGTPDFRKVSMISKKEFDAHKSDPIFKQFSKSNCFGETMISDNTVRFLKDTSDSNCKNKMDFSSRFSKHNGQQWIIDFVIGVFLCP